MSATCTCNCVLTLHDGLDGPCVACPPGACERFVATVRPPLPEPLPWDEAHVGEKVAYLLDYLSRRPQTFRVKLVVGYLQNIQSELGGSNGSKTAP